MYRKLDKIGARVFLIPSSTGKEAERCAMEGLAYLPRVGNRGKAVIIGKNQEDEEYEFQLQKVKTTQNKSLLFAEKVLKRYGWASVFTLVSKDADVEDVAEALLEQMKKDNTTAYIFSCDLGKGMNQEQMLRADDEKILRLVNPNSRLETQMPDMPREMKVLMSLIKKIGAEGKGRVSCYTDSIGKRLGWSTRNMKKELHSYASMMWSVGGDFIDGFHEQFLVSWAHSVIVSKRRGEKELPTLPRWSPFWSKRNGVFVGFGGSAISDHETSGELLPDHVLKAATEIDSFVIRDTDMWKIRVHVDIIQTEDRAMSGSPMPGMNIPQGSYSYQLFLPNGLTGEYLPTLNSESKEWSSGELLSILSRKATNGASDEAWMQRGSRLFIYKLWRIIRT